MSYAEKPEDITREEWMDKLNNVHIQRADMNRLIMNYLVTGEVSFFCDHTFALSCLCRSFVYMDEVLKCGIFTTFSVRQRASRRQQRNSGWSLE